MFLKNRKTISKIKRSKVTDYAALNTLSCEVKKRNEDVILGGGGVESNLVP